MNIKNSAIEDRSIYVSIIVPVRNVQAYIPRFMDSISKQSLNNFEVLCIDDCSSDNSGALLKAWALQDKRVKVLHLPKCGGVGAARNRALNMATGETICFADPDDILPKHSLEVRYAAYKKYNAVVRANYTEIRADNTAIPECRPAGADGVFKPAEVAHVSGVNPFLCGHWAWLWPADLLKKQSIFQTESIRTAEDIHMLVRLFFLLNRVVWIDENVYYWVKRSDSLSTAVYSRDHYCDYLQSCQLFYEKAQMHRKMSLADIFFDKYLVVYLTNLLQQIVDGKSNEEDARRVADEAMRIAEVFNVFPRRQEAILANPTALPGLYWLLSFARRRHSSAIRGLVDAQRTLQKNALPEEFAKIRQKGWSTGVAADKIDHRRQLLRIRYLFYETLPEEVFFHGGQPCAPAYAKTRFVHEIDAGTFFERILWCSLPRHDDCPMTLMLNGQATTLDHSAAQIRALLTPPLPDARTFPPSVQALRRLARNPAIRRRFSGAWLFMDRDTEADDNAEHLYRWIMRHHPQRNIWFVLNEDSHDWPRLQAEGFRLLAHGSAEHGALFLCCSALISSQMDTYIFRPLEERYFCDFPRPFFVGLQHGVIKDDMSRWLNTIPFDLFITSTHAEKTSITDDGTPYLMTNKEVRLAGLARHDAWMEPVEKKNTLFVMPTWRADLVGGWNQKGQRRERNPHFATSLFVRMWQDVMNDPRMENLLQRLGYSIVFFPHPGFEDYLDDFAFPAFVEKTSKSRASISDLMRTSKALLTDFSSVAFEMAYMRRPVVYYHYHDKNAYARSQAWGPGYFDYESMGFGPVCRNLDALFPALETALRANGVMQAPFAERAAQTFAFYDNQCCTRTYEFILEALESHQARVQE